VASGREWKEAATKTRKIVLGRQKEVKVAKEHFGAISEIIFTPNCHFPERHSFDPIVELLADQRSRVQLHVRVNTTACGSRSICEAGVSISHTFVKRSWTLRKLGAPSESGSRNC
jgi:hypothetical protein